MMRFRNTIPVPVPDDPALLAVLIREEATQLGIENVPAHIRHRHNVAHTEEFALQTKIKENLSLSKLPER
jgi:hypothetical protein